MFIHCWRLAAGYPAFLPRPDHKQMAGQTPQLERGCLMTRYLGEGIARHLGRATGLNAEDMEVVAYGLEYLLSAGLGILLTLLAAFLLGLLPETLALLACWILVRRLAGGAHCSTLWRCAAGSCFSAIAAVLISLFAAKSVPVYLWAGAATIWALWATWRWAPNNSKNRWGSVRRKPAPPG